MQEINTVMREFMDRDALFTSVDIANEVKRRGTWVRNRDVAAYLRSHVLRVVGGDYIQTLIEVKLANGTEVPAYVYHPEGTNALEYRDIAQSAMTPDEFNALHPSQAIQLTHDGDQPAPVSIPQPDPQSPASPGVASRMTEMFRNFKWPGRGDRGK